MTFALDHYPPTGRWTVAEIEQFPEDNRRRELLDGSIILRPAPATAHGTVVARVFAALAETCPIEYHVVPGVQVRFSADTAFVPDVFVARRLGHTTFYEPADVLLAAEVVDDGSLGLDRVLKPALYAAAAIPYYWRIETDGGISVHTYKIDPESEMYRPFGTFEVEIDIVEPWPINVPISKLTPRYL